jgi:hypothetical protein
MEAAGSSETVIHFYCNTWHHIPEDSSLQMKTFVMYCSMICINMCLGISNPYLSYCIFPELVDPGKG